MLIINKNILLNSLAVVLFYSCHSTIQSTPVKKEIDLPLFFQNESKNLLANKSKLVKSASKDGIFSSKEISNVDWHKEIFNFLDGIDFNKSAYSKDSINDISSYHQIKGNSDTVIVQLFYTTGRIDSIAVYKSIKNILFSNKEMISYKAGKNYSIQKDQHVLLLGDSKYYIQGKIIK